MKQSFIINLAVVGALMALIGCGGDRDTLSKQEDQRNAVAAGIQGTWISNCESNTLTTLTFGTNTLDTETTTFFDRECKDRSHTVRHAGDLSLTNNYKEGQNNSVVFVSKPEVRATFHTQFQTDTWNNALIKFRNEVKELTIDPKASPAERSRLVRENTKIRALLTLNNFVFDQEMTLSAFQQEKLEDLGFREVQPTTEYGSRTALRYEFDNNHLQIGGLSKAAQVFVKK